MPASELAAIAEAKPEIVPNAVLCADCATQAEAFAAASVADSNSTFSRRLVAWASVTVIDLLPYRVAALQWLYCDLISARREEAPEWTDRGASVPPRWRRAAGGPG